MKKIKRLSKIFMISNLVLALFMPSKVLADPHKVNLAISDLNAILMAAYWHWDIYGHTIDNVTLQQLVDEKFLIASNLYSPWNTAKTNIFTVLDSNTYTISIPAIFPGDDCMNLLIARGSKYYGACASNMDGTFTYTEKDSIVNKV